MYWKIVGVVLSGSAIAGIILRLITYILITYRNHYYELESSWLALIFRWLLGSLIFGLVAIILKGAGINIINKNSNSIELLSLVFGILALYVINFSVQKAFAEKQIKYYLGIRLSNKPIKIKYLDEIVRKPMFSVIIFFVVFGTFIPVVKRNELWSLLWDTCFMIIIMVTLLTITWGYKSTVSRGVMQENVKTFPKRMIESNIENLFIKLVKNKIYYRNNTSLINTMNNFLEGINNNEKGLFFKITYCIPINMVLEKLDKKFLSKWYIKLLREEPLSFYRFQLEFNRVMKKEEIRDIEYLPLILETEYDGLDKILSKKYGIQQEFLKELGKVRKENIIEFLFPQAIINYKIEDLKYWDRINEIYLKHLENLIKTISKTSLKYNGIASSPYREEKGLRNLVEFEIQNIIGREIQLYSKIDVDEYRQHWVQLLLGFSDNYTIAYLRELLPELQKNKVFKSEQYNWFLKELDSKK